jgi:hypothetical protein
MSRHQEKSASVCKYVWLACLLAAVLAPVSLHAHPSTETPGERPEYSTWEELRACRKPIWPQQALNNEQKGDVTVAFLVDVDGAEAANWYRRAADRGDAIAMRRLSAAAATPELVREWLQKAQQADLMKLRAE